MEPGLSLSLDGTDVLRDFEGENSAASLDNLLATVVGAGEFHVFLSLINVVVCAFFCFLLYKLVVTF